MSGKARIEQLIKALDTEEKKMREQIIHLNGQIVYNQRMQETLNQQLRELIVEEDKEAKETKETKSRAVKSTPSKKVKK